MTFIGIAITKSWFLMHNVYDGRHCLIVARPGKAVHIFVEGNEIQIFSQWLP